MITGAAQLHIVDFHVGALRFEDEVGVVDSKRTVSQAARHLVAQTQNTSRVKRREIDFWTRRYLEHLIRDDMDFDRHVDYVHFNPVKHGHVDRVMDWPYSTFHRYVRLGICPSNWAGGGVDEMAGGCGE